MECAPLTDAAEGLARANGEFGAGDIEKLLLGMHVHLREDVAGIDTTGPPFPAVAEGQPDDSLPNLRFLPETGVAGVKW